MSGGLVEQLRALSRRAWVDAGDQALLVAAADALEGAAEAAPPVRLECVFGGEPIDPKSRFVWHHMEGWERQGKAGGSDGALRRRTGKGFACDVCVRKQQRGVAAGQGELGVGDGV